jgi:hypothetical protein
MSFAPIVSLTLFLFRFFHPTLRTIYFSLHSTTNNGTLRSTEAMTITIYYYS